MSQEIYSQYRTHVHYVETVFESIIIPAIFMPHMCCFPFAYGTTFVIIFRHLGVCKQPLSEQRHV